MARRDGRIAVSSGEKERLDGVAQDAFGSDGVPYGATVSMLIEHYHMENK